MLSVNQAIQHHVMPEYALTEVEFLAAATKVHPLKKDGVEEKYMPPRNKPGSDATEEAKAKFAEADAAYQKSVDDEFAKFIIDPKNSDLYLCFQPIWDCSTSPVRLIGVEVLVRLKNGLDNAPMPAMARWQATKREEAMKFLHKQLHVAADACLQLPQNVFVSVNVRPDEVEGAKDLILELAGKTRREGKQSNLLIEITEYSPITEDVLKMISAMQSQGVVFALDDCTEVVDDERPPKALANAKEHSCSFKLGKDHAGLFAFQKLAMQMSCSVFRSEVFPTPKYAGGKPVPFLKNLIFSEEHKDEINKRKTFVEDWITTVRAKNPACRFVIECSLNADDMKTRPELFPKIDLSEGFISMQGGSSGGRGFPLHVFLHSSTENKIDEAATHKPVQEVLAPF